MHLILGTFLEILGLGLWLAAGLVPVLRMATIRRGSAEVSLYLTWMGIIRLHRRSFGPVKDARTVRLPENPDESIIELATEDGWKPLPHPRMRQQLTPEQLGGLIERYIEVGGTPNLSLPLRDRMSMMINFALFFPLGTVSIFAGALLAIGGAK